MSSPQPQTTLARPITPVVQAASHRLSIASSTNVLDTPKSVTPKENLHMPSSQPLTYPVTPATSALQAIYINTPKPVTAKEESFKAKIHLRTGATVKTKYFMNENSDVNITKGLVRGKGVVKSIMADPKYRKEAEEILLKDLHKESQSLCSTKKTSILRSVHPSALQSLKLDEVVKEWQDRSPMLYNVLHTIAGDFANDKTNQSLAISGSILLHHRNKQMSATQHALGLIMDFGGARDRAISVLSNCNIVSAPNTLYGKKKDIEAYHAENIKETILERKLVLELMEFEACLNLPVPIFSVTKSGLQLINWALHTRNGINPIYGLTPLPLVSSMYGSDLDLNARVSQWSTHLLTCINAECIDMTNPGGSSSTCIPDAWNIYGDNLDYNKGVFHRTLDKQNQSLHWFLLVGAPLRVKPTEDLSKERPRRSILHVENHEFLPSLSDNAHLMKDFEFHLVETLVKYIPFLKPFSSCVPKFIPHKFVEEMSQKHEFQIIDLLKKNESKHDDMIDILYNVHQFIPHGAGLQNIIERMVFGGDVLTNERAYSAQMDKVNEPDEGDRLLGVIHRPEGLHMNMNFCRYIMSSFYTSSSAADQGTLYTLAVKAKKTADITLDMTKSYNACRNFLDDCLDAHIIACALKIFEMNDVNDVPKVNGPSPLLVHASDNLRYKYLLSIARKILDLIFQSTQNLAEQVHQIDTQSRAFKNLDNTGKFCCPFGGCSMKYATEGWLKRHLQRKHNVNVNLVPAQRLEEDENFDGIYNYTMSFMKAALLLREMQDAFKMGDGERVFRNIKFLLLYFDRGHHIKYRLWTFRMMAYDLALLSEEERFVYKNNIAINLVGGVRNCIANDNLVEINVHNVKECMRAMGANLTFKSTRRAAMCLDTVGAITEELATEKSGRHTDANTDQDVMLMAATLLAENVMQHIPGREHTTFPNFAHDLLSSVNLVDLNNWLNDQKSRAYNEMQIVV